MAVMHQITLALLFLAEPQLYTRAVPGLGSLCEVKIYAENAESARIVLDDAVSRINYLDSLLSIFSSVSEVSKLNAEKKVQASPELLEAVTTSLEVSKLSQGAFDISIHPLVELWGFYKKKKPPQLPAADKIKNARALVDYRKIVARGDSLIIPGNMMIDLGGIAQGLAVDLVMKTLQQHGIKSALVNIGGEVLAIGRKPNGSKWQVAIRNPRHKETSGDPGITKVVPLEDEAMSTSGDYEKFVMIHGKRYAHIIDPRTGLPAQGCISVTIMAGNAAYADALATAVFVLGPKKAEALLKTLPDVKAIIYVEKKGRVSVGYAQGL